MNLKSTTQGIGPIAFRTIDRRRLLCGLMAGVLSVPGSHSAWNPLLATKGVTDFAASDNPQWAAAIEKGLKWLVGQQTRLGFWNHETFTTAITALAGIALIASGSTTIQGPYAQPIRLTVDYLLSKSRKNGLIGDPQRDHRYTYGHGFAMLFLSQILGEEEDNDRRSELTDVLQRAVDFSVSAQTKAGGWGYVSGQQEDFDEGSTTITQVQGLRGCRNAGMVVPRQAIDRAIDYIYKCKNPDGGISYSTANKGDSRPAITAASLAALYEAGDYKSEHIPPMWEYCRKSLHDFRNDAYGHWHYAYLYYSQVVYRRGPEEWEAYRNGLYDHIVGLQTADGSWDVSVDGSYATSMNLIILQLDLGLLPIFQR